MKNKPAKRTKGKPVATVPPVKPDVRPIQITGSLGGKVVAQDKTDTHQKAEQIAAAWRESGFSVAFGDRFLKTTLPLQPESTNAPGNGVLVETLPDAEDGV
jgi:hypothetical protein